MQKFENAQDNKKKTKHETLDNEQFKRTLNFKAGWKTAVTQAYLIFFWFFKCVL